MFQSIDKGATLRLNMTGLISTPTLPTAGTRLTIVSYDGNQSSDNLYTIRLGGKWEWNSYELAHISKGWNKGTSNIGGGVLGMRVDLWMTASKTKTSIKTLGDFSTKCNIHFAHDTDGTLFVGSAHWMKPFSDLSDPYTNSVSTDTLTMIC